MKNQSNVSKRMTGFLKHVSKKVTVKSKYQGLSIVFGIGFGWFANCIVSKSLTAFSAYFAILLTILVLVVVTAVFRKEAKKYPLLARDITFYVLFKSMLLGVALASFISALIDLPSIYRSGMVIGPFFSSLAIGALFTLIERFADLLEKSGTVS